MQHPASAKQTLLAAALIGLITVIAADALAGEVERINPPGLYKHPAYTRVITARGGKIIFMAGQTPSDMNYKCMHPAITRLNT